MDDATKLRMLDAFGITDERATLKLMKKKKKKEKLRKEIAKEDQAVANREFHDCQPSKLVNDMMILKGMPPHDVGSNFCRGDGFFARDLQRRIHKAGKSVSQIEELAKQQARKNKPSWDR